MNINEIEKLKKEIDTLERIIKNMIICVNIRKGFTTNKKIQKIYDDILGDFKNSIKIERLKK